MQKEKKDKHFIHKPHYPGGLAAMRQLIKDNLRYPKEALTQKVEGTVVVKYAIDYKGNVVDGKVIAGIGHGCDEEAIRLVHLFKFEVPKNRKYRLRFHKDIHIHFRLPKPKPQVQQPAAVTYTVTPAAKPAKKPASTGYTIKWNG
ncbi:MAG: TonB family protein [Saprospirales bacterium]|nr:TonB family protein [Saprospirales bacterium]